MNNDELAVFISTLDPFVMLILFSVVGYISGFWVYKKNFYTAIAVVFIIPYAVFILMWINAVISATLPFLLFATIGYIGIDKTKYYALELLDFLKKFTNKGSNHE
jgi:predicted neutral ceramidase superfamily lipid hydrolase